MTRQWNFTKGLHEIGAGMWAYIQPDGSWGWSNAGLIVDGDQTLLVDTLFDLNLTDAMLKTMRDAVPAAAQIDTLVNTHANGDHTFGNSLVRGARIITTDSVADHLEAEGGDRIVQVIASLPDDSIGKRFLQDIFGSFELAGIAHPPVDDTFVGEMDLLVGDKRVRLVDVGPAHTASDVLVHVPDERVVYTGDILFNGGHPAIWAGPIGNWIKACDTILGWDVDVVVPGHGPICGKKAVRDFKDYLGYFYEEGRKRHEAGMPWQEAAFDLAWGEFSEWGDPERVVINMATLYRELGDAPVMEDAREIWDLMGRYHYKRIEGQGHDPATCTNPAHCH
jgi:cyclase